MTALLTPQDSATTQVTLICPWQQAVSSTRRRQRVWILNSKSVRQCHVLQQCVCEIERWKNLTPHNISAIKINNTRLSLSLSLSLSRSQLFFQSQNNLKEKSVWLSQEKLKHFPHSMVIACRNVSVTFHNAVLNTRDAVARWRVYCLYPPPQTGILHSLIPYGTFPNYFSTISSQGRFSPGFRRSFPPLTS